MRMVGLMAGVVVLMTTWSCADQESRETATSGHLVVSCAESAVPYLNRCAGAFTTLYEKATIDVDTTTSREALVDLVNGKSRLAVMARDLNAAESTVVNSGRQRLVTQKVAFDAIAVIVNGENPVEQLTFEQLEGIFTGAIHDWREVGGPDRPIIPLIRDRNSGTYELFQQRVLHEKGYGATARACSTARQLVAVVAQEPGAIGCAGMAWVQQGNIKAIAVAEKAGGAFVIPSQQSIYDQSYPLRRPLLLCSFGEKIDLVAGFVTFIASAQGQRLAVSEGLVPATMPVRIVQMK